MTGPAPELRDWLELTLDPDDCEVPDDTVPNGGYFNDMAVPRSAFAALDAP
jgi:hypothetical protein